MPIDTEPSPEGTFYLDAGDGKDDPKAYWTPKGKAPNLHASHFATCPDAQKWRKP